MSSLKVLKVKYDKLKYFDKKSLQVNKVKASLIERDDEKEQLKFYEELKLVRKLLTIQAYKHCQNTYDIIENPKGIITKIQFKRGVTSKIAEESEDGACLIAGIPAQYMNEKEFELIEKLYEFIQKELHI
jgi:hypothetical protein